MEKNLHNSCLTTNQYKFKIINDLINFYRLNQSLNPNKSKELVLNHCQLEKMGFDTEKLEEIADGLSLIQRECGLIDKFIFIDPFDYPYPLQFAIEENLPQFPGHLIITFTKEFEKEAEKILLSLKNTLGIDGGGKINIFLSLSDFSLRTNEKDNSSLKYIPGTNRKKLLRHLYSSKGNKGIKAKELIEIGLYKNYQLLSAAIREINELFKSNLNKTKKLIINDNGYKIDYSIYNLIETDD